MHGHALAADEALDRSSRQPNSDLLAHQRVGYAVEMAVDFDVVIDVGLAGLPLCHLERSDGQRPQGWTIERLERILAAAGEFPERPAIEILQEFGDGSIEFGQTEEAPVAQAGEDPALDDLHADFDLGLVLRTIGARRQDHGAVVGSEFGHGALQFGVVAVGVADQGAWIVGDDQFGNATDESECPTDGPEPVGLRFGGRSPGVGVI